MTVDLLVIAATFSIVNSKEEPIRLKYPEIHVSTR